MTKLDNITDRTLRKIHIVENENGVQYAAILMKDGNVAMYTRRGEFFFSVTLEELKRDWKLLGTKSSEANIREFHERIRKHEQFVAEETRIYLKEYFRR